MSTLIEVSVGGLLFISAVVNLLALSAFWVTPSLRTTSNRFVINLLTANFISCIILVPSFFLHPNVIAMNDGADSSILNSRRQTEIREAINTTLSSIECLSNGTGCDSKLIKIDNDTRQPEIDIKYETHVTDESLIDNFRSEEFESVGWWGWDLAATLGSLSVLLVVGDTWCAITDPLRYHSIVSSVRAWIFIILVWVIGITFGIGSSFRTKKVETYKSTSDVFESVSDGEFFQTFNYSVRDIDTGPVTIEHDLYTTIYSTIFFTFVILLPFGLICGMYWRIFSEARGNGLRMRQNGSSPLLQSALNLAASQYAPQPPAHVGNGGLTLKIDKSNRESIKPLLSGSPLQQIKMAGMGMHHKSDKNQNILLTVTADTPVTDQIRRNHSARQLFLLDDTKPGIRHVHSTPNLHRMLSTDNSYNNLHMPNLSVPPKAFSYMSSIRHRLSNASSLFKYREESRAARISILVVIMFLISYLPYGILILIQGHISVLTPYQQIVFAVFTFVLANLSSPFIFAYRNKRVVRGVKRLIGLERQPNERFNSSHQATYKTTIAKVTKKSPNRSPIPKNNRFLTPPSALKATFVLEIEKCTDDEDSNGGSSTTYETKKSFFKRICDSSRKWDCSETCGSGKDNAEQTDV